MPAAGPPAGTSPFCWRRCTASAWAEWWRWAPWPGATTPCCQTCQTSLTPPSSARCPSRSRQVAGCAGGLQPSPCSGAFTGMQAWQGCFNARWRLSARPPCSRAPFQTRPPWGRSARVGFSKGVCGEAALPSPCPPAPGPGGRADGDAVPTPGTSLPGPGVPLPWGRHVDAQSADAGGPAEQWCWTAPVRAARSACGAPLSAPRRVLFRRLHVAGRHTLPSPGQGGASSFSPSGPHSLLCLAAAGQLLGTAGTVPRGQGVHHSRFNRLGRSARHRHAGVACDGHAGEAAARRALSTQADEQAGWPRHAPLRAGMPNLPAALSVTPHRTKEAYLLPPPAPRPPPGCRRAAREHRPHRQPNTGGAGAEDSRLGPRPGDRRRCRPAGAGGGQLPRPRRPWGNMTSCTQRTLLKPVRCQVTKRRSACVRAIDKGETTSTPSRAGAAGDTCQRS